MKKVILIPDSFKGTMSSAQICGIMDSAIKKNFPECEVIKLPVSDGGEGCVDAFLTALNGEKVEISVSGPYGEPISAFYGRIGETAVIEMAAAAGLPLVGENKFPQKATTLGVGEIIKASVYAGAKHLIIGLGGSATNDGGVGAAHACGVSFYNSEGELFLPVGETLAQIDRIDCSGLVPELQGVRITTMCDIDNPLCGPVGAARMFSPQKGADAAMVDLLEAGLHHLSDVIHRDLGIDILETPGAGAAGGMGGGMMAFFGSQLQSGIDTILDVVDFNSLLSGADYVFTGEGKLDNQSLHGKVISGVARRAKASAIPVIAIVGDIGDNMDEAYSIGISGIFSINRVAVPYAQAKKRAETDLFQTMDNLMCFMKQILRS